MTDASVNLWGRQIGAVTWVQERNLGVFQYAPEFVESRIEVSPLTMPLRHAPYEFPTLARDTFKGLPGLLADSLPDKFGNALINAWLAAQGRTPDSFNPVERLCYIGKRGMGALEFEPTLLGPSTARRRLHIDRLVELADQVVSNRLALGGALSGEDDTQVIEDIIRVGTSAGGARAKAILAWNETTGEFRSGQVHVEEGFGHWLMKFDGVSGNRDKELADPQGYGKIEFAYHLMALAAGLEMSRCRLHHEGGRSHFMTQRFDRSATGEKRHMQSLCAMCHYDFNEPNAYSYEQALQAIRQLGMPMSSLEQQFRRAVFNVVGRNHDDHVKNIAYLMDKAGQWHLAPAFDVVYSYNPQGAWTSRHQMSINGKRDDFVVDDLVALAQLGGIKKRRALTLLRSVENALERWPEFCETAGVDEFTMVRIANTQRRFLSA